MGSQVAECSIYNHFAENRSDRRIVLFKAFVSLLVDCFPVLFLMKFKELLNIYVYSDSQGRYTRLFGELDDNRIQQERGRDNRSWAVAFEMRQVALFSRPRLHIHSKDRRPDPFQHDGNHSHHFNTLTII